MQQKATKVLQERRDKMACVGVGGMKHTMGMSRVCGRHSAATVQSTVQAWGINPVIYLAPYFPFIKEVSNIRESILL